MSPPARRLVLALLFALGLLTGSVVYFLLTAGITEAQFRQIEPGMTAAEVEAILGQPADVQCRVDGRVVGPDRFIIDPRGRGDFGEYDERRWESNNLVVIVIFAENAHVVCRLAGPPSPGWVEYQRQRLRRWLGV